MQDVSAIAHLPNRCNMKASRPQGVFHVYVFSKALEKRCSSAGEGVEWNRVGALLVACDWVYERAHFGIGHNKAQRATRRAPI